jgi:DNA-binding transcriptional regulator YiaG
MFGKGRYRSRTDSGEKNPNARLKASEVTDIRRRYKPGISQQTLAREFGVTQVAISLILRRRTWATEL